jgi:hypothetical protein
MTVAEVYGDDIAAGLYTFNADNPYQNVEDQIRRHCIGLVFPTGSQSKHYRIVDHNKCYFLGTLTARGSIRRGAGHRWLRKGALPAKAMLWIDGVG